MKCRVCGTWKVVQSPSQKTCSKSCGQSLKAKTRPDLVQRMVEASKTKGIAKRREAQLVKYQALVSKIGLLKAMQTVYARGYRAGMSHRHYVEYADAYRERQRAYRASKKQGFGDGSALGPTCAPPSE